MQIFKGKSRDVMHLFIVHYEVHYCGLGRDFIFSLSVHLSMYLETVLLDSCSLR